MKPVKTVSTAIVLVAVLYQAGCRSDSNSTTQSDTQSQVTQSDSTTLPDSKTDLADSHSTPTNELFDKVRSIISTSLEVDTNRIRLDAQLEDDLGADDFDKTDLVLALEKQFDITIDDADWDNVKTVNDVVEVVTKNRKVEDRPKVRY